MAMLEPTEAIFPVDEEILNFFGGVEEEDEKVLFGGGAAAAAAPAPSSSLDSSITTVASSLLTGSHTGVMEEELEWLSNKDAFPALDTCFGILADNPELLLSKESPISVLENSSSSSNSNENVSPVASCCRSLKVPINFPVRARSKRRRSRRREGFGELLSQHLWLGQVNVKNRKELAYPLPPPAVAGGSAGGGMGRRCLHCQADKTPQWRAGPMGPKTLCNACGVRFKSGRLLPEYRPANSPTFVSSVHSNSHRKVVEIRKQKHFGTGMRTGGGGIVGNEACG